MATVNELLACSGMSADDFYGRKPAAGVDLAACHRAAKTELRRRIDSFICSGTSAPLELLIRQTVLRLSVALGNQSRAESALVATELGAVKNWIDEGERKDAEQLENAVNRMHAHPLLSADLKNINAKIDFVANA